MNTKKTLLIIFLLAFCLSALIFPQEDTENDYIKIDDNLYDLLRDKDLQLVDEIKETDDNLYYSILYLLLEYKTFVEKYRTIGDIEKYTVIEPLEIKKEYEIDWKSLFIAQVRLGKGLMVTNTGNMDDLEKTITGGDYLKPADYDGTNVMLVFYDNDVQQDTKCYYEIKVDDARLGTTNVAYLGQEKAIKLQLTPGKRALLKATKYINDRRRGAWIKALNIEQLSEIYIVGAKDKIMKIEFIYNAETKKYSYKNSYLKVGDEDELK